MNRAIFFFRYFYVIYVKKEWCKAFAPGEIAAKLLRPPVEAGFFLQRLSRETQIPLELSILQT